MHVLMRDEKEGRSKQGQTNNKAKQHSTPKAVTFQSCLGHVHVRRLVELRRDMHVHVCMYVGTQLRIPQLRYVEIALQPPNCQGT